MEFHILNYHLVLDLGLTYGNNRLSSIALTFDLTNGKALQVYYSADSTIKGSMAKKDHKEQIYFRNGH